MVPNCQSLEELQPIRMSQQQQIEEIPKSVCHVTTNKLCKYTTLVDIPNVLYKNYSHTSRTTGAGIAQWLEHRTRD